MLTEQCGVCSRIAGPPLTGCRLVGRSRDEPELLARHPNFHGDNGAGLGAMHQTGWTALVADLLLDPPRRTRRMIFYDDDTTRTPQE